MNKIVLGMAIIRLVSGTIELLAAFVMMRLNVPEKALMVNIALAVIGPLVLISTTTLGLVGIADKLSPGKFVWILLGVVCLFIGILKK